MRDQFSISAALVLFHLVEKRVEMSSSRSLLEKLLLVARNCLTCAGRCSTPTGVDNSRRKRRSITFLSSRTLPGQSYFNSPPRNSSVNFGICEDLSCENCRPNP